VAHELRRAVGAPTCVRHGEARGVGRVMWGAMRRGSARCCKCKDHNGSAQRQVIF
jgi:hypothetical protein